MEVSARIPATPLPRHSGGTSVCHKSTFSFVSSYCKNAFLPLGKSMKKSFSLGSCLTLFLLISLILSNKLTLDDLTEFVYSKFKPV